MSPRAPSHLGPRSDEEIRILMGKIISRGFHSLAAEHRPDRSGDPDFMRLLKRLGCCGK